MTKESCAFSERPLPCGNCSLCQIRTLTAKVKELETKLEGMAALQEEVRYLRQQNSRLLDSIPED